MNLDLDKNKALLSKYPVDEYPESNKYISWIIDQIENHGLKSINLTPNRSNCDDRVEELNKEIMEKFCAELNRMIEAPAVEDSELFPESEFKKGYRFS